MAWQASVGKLRELAAPLEKEVTSTAQGSFPLSFCQALMWSHGTVQALRFWGNKRAQQAAHGNASSCRKALFFTTQIRMSTGGRVLHSHSSETLQVEVRESQKGQDHLKMRVEKRRIEGFEWHCSTSCNSPDKCSVAAFSKTRAARVQIIQS